jgi:DNA replication protein DnaC
MTDAPQLLLAHHLKALKLPTFLREYDKLARQCAAEGLDHTRYLLRLAELELIDRERRMVERRIKEARFPAVKSLDSFDFAAIPSLNKTLVLELARSEYVTRRENIIAVGNSNLLGFAFDLLRRSLDTVLVHDFFLQDLAKPLKMAMA